MFHKEAPTKSLYPKCLMSGSLFQSVWGKRVHFQSYNRGSEGTLTLMNMFSDLFEARDKGRCSALVMLDYSQIFGSINHSGECDLLGAFVHGRREVCLKALAWDQFFSRSAQQTCLAASFTVPPKHMQMI
ncbi:hypothetical protein J6590_036584 [Homalodisca vitripennis]|nr:hypothetical protein J6590_036584 [Homalodisca vitripennis]